MRKIRDVLRYRHSTDLSLEAIARALNISKGAVVKYLQLATKAELVWPLPADLDDAALERRLYPQPSTRASAFTEPDYARVHQELKRKGMTLSLLWEEWSLSGVDNTDRTHPPQRRFFQAWLKFIRSIRAPAPFTGGFLTRSDLRSRRSNQAIPLSLRPFRADLKKLAMPHCSPRSTSKSSATFPVGWGLIS